MQRLINQYGETIGETLVALLISSLALMMLAGAISTAGHMISKSEDSMNKYYESISALGNPSIENILSIKIKKNENELYLVPKIVSGSEYKKSISVKYYLNSGFANIPVISYAQ